MESACFICDRIKQIQEGVNRYFVKELKTGYVVIGDYQYYRGYTLFLSKKHVVELHELDDDYRKEFLHEMSIVSKAVFKAFHPHKLNYELLGNAVPHMHWHLFPRYENDPQPNKPTANIVCDDDTYSCLQFPFNESNQTFAETIATAQKREKMVIINRPFNMGAPLYTSETPTNPDALRKQAYEFILKRLKKNGVILTGTKTPHHLKENYESFIMAKDTLI